MAGTYTQIYIQIIIAVKGRENLLQPPWKAELTQYMGGILNAKNEKPYIINGPADHLHILMGLRPVTCLSDVVRDLKSGSTNFINHKKLIKGHFSWQEGYGAFSYSKSQLPAVYKYIQNQEEHHRKKSFKEEYVDFLRKYEIEHNEKYLFEWIH